MEVRFFILVDLELDWFITLVYKFEILMYKFKVIKFIWLIIYLVREFGYIGWSFFFVKFT